MSKSKTAAQQVEVAAEPAAKSRVSLSVTIKGARRKPQDFSGIDAAVRALQIEGANPSTLKRIRATVKGGEAVEVTFGTRTYIFAPTAQ